MSLNLIKHEMSVHEYLVLSVSTLLSSFRTTSPSLISTVIEQLSWRIVLLVAPKNYCWGLNYHCDQGLRSWHRTALDHPEVDKLLLHCFEEYGIDPNSVIAGLLKYHAFGEDGQLEFDPAVGHLPTCWFRAEIIPSDKRSLEIFERSLAVHGRELGQFFMMPYSDSLVSTLAGEEYVSPVMQDLFVDVPGARLADVHWMDKKVELLERVIAGTDVSALLREISPHFLEHEFIRLDYPLPGAIRQVKSKSKVFNTFSQKSETMLFEEKRRVSLLRAQVMGRLGWPVGIRMLNRAYVNDKFRSFKLSGSEAWQPLECEVRAILESAKVTYPLLFS